jgi:hypothetical protein
VTGRCGAPTYRIVVEGRLDESWSRWLGDLRVQVEAGLPGGPVSTLTGSVADQAALRGILTRMWNLNLKVLSVTRLQSEEDRDER